MLNVDSRTGSIFEPFVSTLAPTFTLRADYNVGVLMQQVVGVHRTWADLQEKQPSFVPVTFTLERVITGNSGVIARVRTKDPTSRARDLLIAAARSGKWKRVQPSVGGATFEFETRTAQVGVGRGRGYVSARDALSAELRAQGVHALVTPQGYRYYVSHLEQAEKFRLPQPAAIYALMFYFGSITRYRPYDWDRFVNGNSQWLVNEFITTQPPQFVYLLACELANNEVTIPFSDVGPRGPIV